MADETIARATIQLGADGSKLAPEMAAAVAKAQGTLDAANRKAANAQKAVVREIQGYINSINAAKPTNDMRMLEQAVLRLGGTSKLTGEQVARVAVEVNRLAAAGAKVPASLSNLTTMGSKLGAAFQSLTTGGGISGALASLGPAGVAAAAGLGAVTLAGGAAVREIADLAAQAEQWGNIAKSTGLGITEVQQLSAMLEDAGIPAEALKKGMKALSDEIAGGGKQLEAFGISIKGWDLMTQEERLRAMAKIISEIEDPATASAVAVAAFGKSGADLIPVMEDVASGADKMYSALSEGSIGALARADATIDAFTRKLTNAKRTLLAGAIELAQGLTFVNGIPMWAPNADAAAAGAAVGAGKGPASAGEQARQARQAAIEKAKADKEAAAAAKQRAAEEKKLADERGRKIREQIDAEVNLLKAREDETLAMQKQAEAIAAGSFAAEDQAKVVAPGSAGSIKDWEQNRQTQAIALAEAAQKAGLGVDQIRGKLEGMGFTAEEAAHLTDTFLTKQKETVASTETAADRLGTLSQQLQYLASVTGGVAGKILSLAASISSGLGGVLNGLKEFRTSGGGLTGLLGKIGGVTGIVGSVIGIGSSLFSGIKSLFGGKSKEQKQAEADAKRQKQEEARQAAIDAATRRQAAAESAQGFAQSLSDRISSGKLSEKLAAALGGFVGQLGAALGKFGLGVVDSRLKDSEAFQAASGVAGDVAGGLGAAREAGIADAAMITAAGAAAAQIQEDAIAAARAAGLSDREAAKQGSLAVAQILRQQLNASIQSGNELDENTKALLEEAKANGIEIMADPMIESLAVQKDILATLRGQPLGGGSGTGTGAGGGTSDGTGGGANPDNALPRDNPAPDSEYPDYKRRRPQPAASGIAPTIFGSNPRPIQPHQGELGMIIPRADVSSVLRGTGAMGTTAAAGGGMSYTSAPTFILTLPPGSTTENARQIGEIAVGAFLSKLRENDARACRDVATAVRPHL